MKRETVLSLRKTVWLEVPGKDLSIAVVPAEARVLGLGEEVIAEKAFIDFKGYTEENGDAVPNSLEARMELLTANAVRRVLFPKLMELNDGALKGEAVAGSA